MKMIQGGRALAAALAGAKVFVATVADGWQPAAFQEAARRTWRRRYDRSDDGANVFAVCAEDAERVLG